MFKVSLRSSFSRSTRQKFLGLGLFRSTAIDYSLRLLFQVNGKDSGDCEQWSIAVRRWSEIVGGSVPLGPTDASDAVSCVVSVSSFLFSQAFSLPLLTNTLSGPSLQLVALCKCVHYCYYNNSYYCCCYRGSDWRSWHCPCLLFYEAVSLLFL